MFPLVEWDLISGVTYNGYRVYQHPQTQELAWDTYFEHVTLPPVIETAIRNGVKGDLRD